MVRAACGPPSRNLILRRDAFRRCRNAEPMPRDRHPSFIRVPEGNTASEGAFGQRAQPVVWQRGGRTVRHAATPVGVALVRTGGFTVARLPFRCMPAVHPNLLVIRRRYLGDIVLLGPFFANLRRHWPQARITALVERPYAECLSLHPAVDAGLVLPAPRGRLGEWWQLLRRLRTSGFSHVFDLDNTAKTAVLTRWTGAGFRVALLHEMPPRRPWLYTHLAIDPPAQHESRSIVEYYLHALPPAGVPVITHEVRLVPRAADVSWAQELLGRLPGGPVPAGTRRLLVHPGSRSPFRLWPPERFGEVCRRVRTELDARVVFVAGPGEQSILQQILPHAGADPLVIDQPLSVSQFAALAAQFDLLLCHDSGPMHLAAAVGTPVVALFGSQNMALWRPSGDQHTLLQPSMPCRNCVAPGVCVPGDAYHNYCIRSLGVNEVFAAVREQLARPAGHP